MRRAPPAENAGEATRVMDWPAHGASSACLASSQPSVPELKLHVYELAPQAQVLEGLHTAPGVEHDDVRIRCIHESRRFDGEHTDAMGQQTEGREHLGGAPGRWSEQQQICHLGPPRVRVGATVPRGPRNLRPRFG